MAEFAIDAATMPRPRWQDDERRAQDMMPAFLSGGLFILVVAAGILWIVRFQYPSERVPLRDSRPADTPIAPALAVALADRGRELRLPMLGTTIDLAVRRLVAFEPGEGAHIRVVVAKESGDLLAHERVVLDALQAHLPQLVSQQFAQHKLPRRAGIRLRRVAGRRVDLYVTEEAAEQAGEACLRRSVFSALLERGLDILEVAKDR
jgi:hypothetical protein